MKRVEIYTITFITLLLPVAVFANGIHHDDYKGAAFHTEWWILLIISLILMSLLSWSVHKYLKVK
ncbi:hypothetical protein MYX06_01725 [Patescibacteria group bacterium AH-259-L05]|nr:hypothetical protein [Patescibacteria group bacterium AH-259-L05]